MIFQRDIYNVAPPMKCHNVNKKDKKEFVRYLSSFEANLLAFYNSLLPPHPQAHRFLSVVQSENATWKRLTELVHLAGQDEVFFSVKLVFVCVKLKL
jgi:hypothetical protein